MLKRRISRILVVDDEKAIAATLAAILERNGFSVASFTDPLEALKNALLELPDLLLSDVMMPGLSGIDLALKMKEKCPNCEVLLFSGQAATVDLLHAARDQGHNFHLLSKPVHPNDLLRGIRNLELNTKDVALNSNG